MIRVLVLAATVLSSERPPLATSASMPYFRLTNSSTYMRTSSRTIVNGEEVKCLVCGKDPSFVRVIEGRVEAYCAEHKK